jgi:hypothetical protein
MCVIAIYVIRLNEDDYYSYVHSIRSYGIIFGAILISVRVFLKLKNE